MAREEILKQVVYVSKNIRDVKFTADGTTIDFVAPEEEGAALSQAIEKIANRLASALRTIQRKVLFRSSIADRDHFFDCRELAGVHIFPPGQAVLEELPLALFRYFDRVFEDFGLPWRATPMLAPTLISGDVLARCDYFRSFPHYVTFTTHLKEEAAVIERFRARHETENRLLDDTLGDMVNPTTCLAPAMCYHVYDLYTRRTIPVRGVTRSICGPCFRFESANIRDLRRLQEFTMRELVFLGSREDVLACRERSIEMMSKFLEHHSLAAEIRTASDPFFISPDAVSKTYFQLRSDSKYEVSLFLPGGDRVAAASHNYHSDFFGRAFETDVESKGRMHSVCVAFGLERWVYAFLVQHGTDPTRWPSCVRRAPEICQLEAASKRLANPY
jgi:seryl-tRNA synthetase